MRTRYLVCYDVHDEARLRRVARIAEEFGERLQYSVFLCDLSAIEKARFVGRLRHALNLDDDRAVMIDLGPPGPGSTQRFSWITRCQPTYDPGDATII